MRSTMLLSSYPKLIIYSDNSKEHAFFYLSIMLRQLANENAQGECPLSLTLSGSFALSQ